MNLTPRLVETVVAKMKRGKAAGLGCLTAEHLKYSHPVLSCVLSILFNSMVKLGHVPHSFGKSYTVPVLKTRNSIHSKTITADDLRVISISPVISKVLDTVYTSTV